MSRLQRLGQLLKPVLSAQRTPGGVPPGVLACATRLQGAHSQSLPVASNLWVCSQGFSTGAAVPADYEHATGAEREELEAKHRLGVDNPYHEEWLDAPWGTETNPVEVTSHFSQRVVGVPDPYDDSIVWWDTIHAGQPPKQIIEDGEFFILKQLEGGGHGHH
ncbi:hypothetical protein WJX74_008649 [Apatococcus lobatus]|uniref:Uncharacterized protein n=1 Tax=Apatococcus lobatus TaxID=904363 RepID=A0AAW1RSN2_9CHLO